jgi:hypothetical protein
MNKIWLPLPGYEGIYSVSDAGDVMSMNYAGTGMMQLLTPNKVIRGGYWRVSLFKDHKQKTSYIHSLVMLTFVGPRPKGLQINHKNADKRDNRLCNLEYCTALENKHHAMNMGLWSHSESNGGAKLTNDQVEQIKLKLASGIKRIQIAKEYGVHRATIYRIEHGKLWLSLVPKAS